MLTSSPTISAPSSPSAPFHTHARPYQHASRRTSASSHSHSPRFLPQVSGASSRRLDTPQHHSTSTTSAQSPVPAFFPRSPQPRKREYADAGTQYTPPGYPPTYHPPVAAIASLASPATFPEDSIRDEEQGETSATPVVTEPPEPQLRIDPRPVVPIQQHVPPDRMLPRAAGTQDGHQSAGQPEASTIDQAQSTPAKRARPQDPNVKVMPLKYETCDVKDLGVLISDMLMELVRLNDGFPLRDGTLTRFHSRYHFQLLVLEPNIDHLPQSSSRHFCSRLPLPPYCARHTLPAHPTLHGVLCRQAMHHVPSVHDQQPDCTSVPYNGGHRSGKRAQ